MSATHIIETVWAMVVVSVGYPAIRSRNRRVAFAARIALGVIVVLTVAAIWAGIQFERNFTIPPM